MLHIISDDTRKWESDTQESPDIPIDWQLTLDGWLALHPEYGRLFSKMTQ